MVSEKLLALAPYGNPERSMLVPKVVEVPKIVRERQGGYTRGSKYVPDGAVADAAVLLTHPDNRGVNYIGELISPVDTITKARIAAKIWKQALAEYLELDKSAFSVRVFTLAEQTEKNPNVWTFAIAIKPGA